MSELPGFVGQPQIDVDGHEVKDWPNELGVGLAQIGRNDRLVGIERNALTKRVLIRGERIRLAV